MAKVVIVHGVGKQFMGEETILRDWLPALRDGLTRAGHKKLNDADVKCTHYLTARETGHAIARGI